MNNGGWGLRVMLFFCIAFILFIVVAAYLLNTNFKSIAPKESSKPKYSYFDLETRMVNAAKSYTNKMYNDIEEDIEIEIKLKTLINSNYLVSIKDPYDNKECNGYVILKKEKNSIQYEPYLKCGANYKTIGYDTEYE